MKMKSTLNNRLQSLLLLMLASVLFQCTESENPDAAALNLADMIQPVPESAIFSQEDYYVWGGSIIRSEDGTYHLFYSRWQQKFGFNAWVTHSEIAHAIGDSPVGAFSFSDVTLPVRGNTYWDGLCTHNPTILKEDGKYYLYYMGNTGDGKVTEGLNWSHRNNQRIGVAVADKPEGPWKRFDQPLLDVSTDSNAPDALMVSNPAVSRGPDGGFLMIYKAVGLQRALPFGGPVVHLTATSDAPTGPFTKQMQPVFTAPGVDFPAEDPFVWYDKKREKYYAVVKDMEGYFTNAGRSLALWESFDGLDWRQSENILVSTTKLKWIGGSVQELDRLERPQLLFDENNKPIVLICAVAETPDGSNSYNVRIPLK